MTAENFDIRRLRSPYESDAEWRLRQVFLSTHKDKFPVHRLLCLSNCYINSEVYGSRYSPPVMQELQRLKSELPKPAVEPSRMKGVEKVKFVKSESSADETKPSTSNQGEAATSPSKRRTTVEYKVGVAKKPSPTKPGNSAASTTTETSTTTTRSVTTTTSSNAARSTTATTTTRSTPTTTSTNAAKSTAATTTTTSTTRSTDTSSVTENSTEMDTASVKNEVATPEADSANSKKGKDSSAVGSVTSASASSTTTTTASSNGKNNPESKPAMYSFPPNYVPKRIAADWEPKTPTPVFRQNVPKPKPKSLKDAQRFNPDVVSTKFADFMMPIDQKFFSLAQTYYEMQMKDPNYKPLDILPIAGMKCKMAYTYKFEELPAPKGLHKFTCVLTCENVEIGVGHGGNKKAAKKDSVSNAGEKLSKHYLKVARVNPERQELQASDEYFTSAWSLFENNSVRNNAPIERESNAHVLEGSKKRKFSELHGDLSKFLIIEPLELSGSDNSKTILQQSADFNKALLEYEFHNDSTGVRCRLQIEGQTLVEFFGTTRASTKTVAAEKALEGLRKICWTIKVKQAVDSDEVSLTRDSVLGDIQKQVECISEDNIGNQMLRKMGWTGGGVGADGNKGREVPVAIDMQQVIRREGLGIHSSDNNAVKNFREKVKDIIDNYAKSDKQEDLVFAPDFSKEERAFMHQHAQKYGLKTQSRGSSEERYLTLSRKRTPDQLFNHLIEEGGSTSKYELVPPQQGGIICGIDQNVA